jgi:putative glycosyltransferase
MKLSVVATLYQSASSLPRFCERASNVAESVAGEDYEIILVNDGSPDHSLDVALSLAQANPRLVIVDLSRNFGHHKAMMTGLAQSSGERVFLLDCDLEEEPEWLIGFEKQMNQSGCDVVYGVQTRRKGGWLERLTGAVFYRMFNLITGIRLPKDVVTARLMTRRYVEGLIQHEEREVFIAGLWHLTGFEQQAQPVRKHNHSPTTYSLGRKFSLLVNAVTAFSNAPLIAIFHFGLMICLGAALYISYLLINWYFFQRPLSGWTSVIASIWLLGGLTISFLGIIGLYLSRIYTETKTRPYTIIRHIHRRH